MLVYFGSDAKKKKLRGGGTCEQEFVYKTVTRLLSGIEV